MTAPPLIEAALAVRHVRENAEKYHIDPRYVFITGFSAGGHVAACCGTMWKDAAVLAAMGDAPYGIWKPTATVLCYPVITATMFTHYGSIDTISNGHAKDGETIEHWSVEKHVDADTAPAFIWHTFDDAAVPIQNTLLYANALAAAGVPFEYHVYPVRRARTVACQPGDLGRASTAGCSRYRRMDTRGNPLRPGV